MLLRIQNRDTEGMTDDGTKRVRTTGNTRGTATWLDAQRPFVGIPQQVPRRLVPRVAAEVTDGVTVRTHRRIPLHQAAAVAEAVASAGAGQAAQRSLAGRNRVQRFPTRHNKSGPSHRSGRASRNSQTRISGMSFCVTPGMTGRV